MGITVTERPYEPGSSDHEEAEKDGEEDTFACGDGHTGAQERLLMNERLGEIAYNAYCAARDWKSVRGEPLPHWKQQDESLRAAWVAAAAAVANDIGI